jgi:ribonuclease-3
MNLLSRTAERLRNTFSSLVRRSAARTTELSRLEDTLGYRFKDQGRLRQSLVHRSCTDPAQNNGLASNERLEFLGDAVLNCLVTEHLYRTYPDKQEGQLSKMKSLIVSRKILGEVAVSIDLGSFVYLGQSEKKSGGKARRSILSNAFEAVVGAMYLDGGLLVVRDLLARILFTRIAEFLADERNINYKSSILEMGQRDGFGVPRYAVVSTKGPEHAKEFTVAVSVAGVQLGTGRGSNKKIAEQAAARMAIDNYSREYILSQSKGVAKDELVSQ